jgi:hypothetical protein
LLPEVPITSKFRECGLLAHSSGVVWWNNGLSPEHLHVFHFVWHLPFDLFSLGGSTISYATADIALIGAHKTHHHNKVETHGGEKVIDYRIKAIKRTNEFVSQEVAYGLRSI